MLNYYLSISFASIKSNLSAMKYTLINRKKSTSAKNHTDFVTYMRKHDLQDFSTNSDFMEAYAHRKMTFENIVLRSSSEDDFVEDLIKNQLVTIDGQDKKPILGFLKI